jgi:hypothetical protein
VPKGAHGSGRRPGPSRRDECASRVTNDHGCYLNVGILAEFVPNNQNQSVAGCSVFEFAGGENVLGFRVSGRDQALRSRPGPSVVTKARQTQVAPTGGGWGVGVTITMG